MDPRLYEFLSSMHLLDAYLTVGWASVVCCAVIGIVAILNVKENVD